MQKKCRKCKEPKEIDQFPQMNMGKYWVWKTCLQCIAEKAWSDNINSTPIKRTALKQSQKPLNKVSSTNKNTPARFTQKTKDEILARDKVCIITWKKIEQYHHVFFGPHDANYWPNRNAADQGVWLNSEPHRIIHHPSPKEIKEGRIIRVKCINYLLNLKK